ncbi:PGAP1-like protein-domain-containing protein [Sporodiniella umbellata]|nr:PGAP1-like protein-domain-containing protein [Sporodiniella umbellata]
MTRFAGKYSLYLYREKGVDFTDKPTGVPVLFIPGHAGSYKQVRSLAAEAAFSYYSKYENHAYSKPPGVANLDFFTVDFNEEFSALHGQSILEQAEYLNDAIDYILKLYPQTRLSDLVPDATSVIIIGHSMGGIVARTMLMMHNHQIGTINTIVTLSTPHLLPPAPFDWKISQLYDDINQIWQEKAWKDLAMISIAGGTLDNTVCSDSTNIEAILSPEHGFTVFSTAVPHVWTAADHVSVLTCNQLVKVVSKTLLDIVDIRRGSQTKPLKERMQILRQAFLSGLEDRHGNGSDIKMGNISEFDKATALILPAGKRLVLEQESKPGLILLPTVANANAFAILTDDRVNAFERFEFYLCQNTEISLVCQEINSIVVPVPASTEKDIHSFSGNTFSFASLRFDEMKSYRYLGIRDKGTSASRFLVAEPFDTKMNHQVVHQSMLSIALEGVHVKTKSGMFTSIRIPSIESPILAYHLKVSRPNCLGQSHFTPFLRQSISTMHESKFYVNLAGDDQDETEISIHGRTAFAAVVNHRDKHGLSFQIWMDPSCLEPLQLDLSIDWYGSAGRLGFRNGIMLATFSFIVVMLVFVCQIKCYNNSGIYPHFGQGLSFCLQRTLPLVMVCLTLGSIGQCTSYFKDSFWLPGFASPIARKDIMTGNTDPFFWWIPLLGLTVSVGIVCLLWLVVEGFLRLVACISECCAFTLWPISRAQETRYHQIQRRTVTTCILFMLVATCIPYQFVFVVAFFVQIIGCVRALMRLKIPTGHRRKENRYHFMFSLLLLFFTLLPFNLPILLVWIRNISVNWFVPFSSDHSVLAIAPIMVYVEILTSHRKMLPRQNDR